MSIKDYQNTLRNKVVLITGAGGGIGLETAKKFALMGAKVIIADIDKIKGMNAEIEINAINTNSTYYYYIDLRKETCIDEMKDYILDKYGCPDIIFNNAAILPLGNIESISSTEWETGYLVNLKAPFLLANRFLSYMKKRNSGIFVFVSSSGAVAGMGAYEIFKTAQVELCNTISMELENTNIYAFTISPGLVKTETAMKSIEAVAKNMSISLDEFYKMNKEHLISVENASLGFALSVLNAEKYNGQEVGSIQVINGMIDTQDNITYCTCDLAALERVCNTFIEQYHGWKQRNIFERQWVLRDFKKSMGLSADEAYTQMIEMKESNGRLSEKDHNILVSLITYWRHQQKLLDGFEKDRQKLKKNHEIISGWIRDIECCMTKFQLPMG